MCNASHSGGANHEEHKAHVNGTHHSRTWQWLVNGDRTRTTMVLDDTMSDNVVNGVLEAKCIDNRDHNRRTAGAMCGLCCAAFVIGPLRNPSLTLND